MEKAIGEIIGQLVNYQHPYGLWVGMAILVLFGLLALRWIRFGEFITIACGVMAVWAVSVMGWETAGPFVWLLIGAMATLPMATYAGEAVRRWDWLTPTVTMLALCATIAIWDIPQGLMSGLAIAVFAGMALAAEGLSAKWKYGIFLILIAGLFMLAGANGTCVLLIAFGHFATCFMAFALAFTCAYEIRKKRRMKRPMKTRQLMPR